MNDFFIQAVPEIKYIPVGSRFTREQVDNMSQSQLSRREILDPKFAGFDPKFDWHNYIQIDMKPGLARAEAEVTLNQMSQTPEGQHILRQAFAMQQFRDSATQVDHRIVVTDQNRRHFTRDERNQATSDSFYQNSGVVFLAPGDRHYTEYPTLNGDSHPFSVQSTLVHELLHAADALVVTSDSVGEVFANDFVSAMEIAARDFSQKNSNVSQTSNEQFQKLENELYEAVYASVFEHAAIRSANAYLLKYYGTPERAIQHGIGNAPDLKMVAEPSEAAFFYADGHAPQRRPASTVISNAEVSPPTVVPEPPVVPTPVMSSPPDSAEQSSSGPDSLGPALATGPVPNSPPTSLAATNSPVEASRELLGALPVPRVINSNDVAPIELRR